MGFPVDKNIEEIVVFLNSCGVGTSNSCGHEGTVDVVDDISRKDIAKVMRKLKLPRGWWRTKDYAEGSKLKKSSLVIQFIGVKPYTEAQWKRVCEINEKACEFNKGVR